MSSEDPLLDKTNKAVDADDVIVINSNYTVQALYALRCSVGGFVAIFLPIFYVSMGLSDFEIGIITTFGPLCGIVGNPMWGAVADQRPGSRKGLMICTDTVSV